jgi:ribosome-binding factor A
MRRDEEKEGAGYRHLRLQGLILEELRALLRDDVADPALTVVRITAVVLSVDYRQARVHFATLGNQSNGGRPGGDAERALGRATPFLRARLADALDLKRVPDLRFLFDGVVAVDLVTDEEDAPCSG